MLAIVSYSLSKSQRWSFETNHYVPYEKDRRHNLKAASSIPLSRGFEMGAGIRLSSGAPKYPTVRQIWYEDKGYFDFIQYRSGAGRFGPYFALDVKVAQKFWKNRMQWFIDIKNLNALWSPSIEFSWPGMYFDYERQEWIMATLEGNCQKQQIYPAAGFRVNF